MHTNPLPSLSLEVVRTEEQFASVRSIWNDLLDRSGQATVSLTWEWLATWHECLRSPERELDVIVVREGAVPIAIAPFQRVRRRWCGVPYTTVEFLSQSRQAFSDHMVSSRLDVICAGRYREVADLVILHLVTADPACHVVRLEVFAEGSIMTASLMEAAVRHGLLARTGEEVPSYDINAPEGWDEYFRTRSRHFRKHVRNNESRLRRQGGLEVVHLDAKGSPEETFRRILDVERRATIRGPSIDSPVYRGFYERFLRTAAMRGWQRMTILTLDGKDIAFLWSVVYGGRLDALRTAYDRSFARFSPGVTVLRHHFQRFLESGHAHVNLMQGAGEFKGRWSTDERLHREVFLFGSGWRARFLLLMWLRPHLYRRSRRILDSAKAVLRRLGIRRRRG